jgi:alpha-ketoglutarate-dependent taurine dioxygenase
MPADTAVSPRENPMKLQRPTWWGADLTREKISCELSAEQWRVIDDLLQALKAKGTKLEDITKAQFSHPKIDGTLADILREIRTGRGALILRGFPVEKYDLADIERVYIGIGCHAGIPVSQNTRGDIIGHVTDKKSGAYGKKTETGAVVLRGYENNSELELHTDSADLAVLLCIRKAKSGGMSSIADAFKVYEILASEFPKELALLEKGWPAHRRNEQAPGEAKVTPYDVPAFGWKDGLLSCRKNSIAAHDSALEALGRGGLDAEGVAALRCFDTVAARPEVRSDMQLEPGEVLFLNNFEFLHARTQYEDWDDPSQKRLLLRLWLEFDPPRPINRHMLTFQNASGFKGVDKLLQPA